MSSKIIPRGFTYDYGDTDVYGDYGDIVRQYQPTDFDSRQMIDLGYFDINPLVAIKQLNNVIEVADLFKDTYTCPVTKYVHHPIIPCFVLTENPTPYGDLVKPSYKEMMLDEDWNTKDELIKSECDLIEHELTPIKQIILGSGYTCCTLPSDGSYSIVPVSVDFDNGDVLVCLALVWHNK
jgi:hypothetical protein